MQRTTLKAAGGIWTCPQVWIAHTYLQRLRGLLGWPPLGPDQGLLLRPGRSVHTLGMRYPIDIVHLDQAAVVLGVRCAIRPWRGVVAPRGTAQTLELAAGGAYGLREGMTLVAKGSV